MHQHTALEPSFFTRCLTGQRSPSPLPPDLLTRPSAIMRRLKRKPFHWSTGLNASTNISTVGTSSWSPITNRSWRYWARRTEFPHWQQQDCNAGLYCCLRTHTTYASRQQKITRTQTDYLVCPYHANKILPRSQARRPPSSTCRKLRPCQSPLKRSLLLRDATRFSAKSFVILGLLGLRRFHKP